MDEASVSNENGAGTVKNVGLNTSSSGECRVVVARNPICLAKARLNLRPHDGALKGDVGADSV
jgi:hypothetical protein